jgi:hypothetical protein
VFPRIHQPDCGSLPHLLIQQSRNGYLSGERVEADVFSPSGQHIGLEIFVIQAYAGSGFAGQVYRASPVGGVLRSTAGIGATQPVAIKILKPKSRWKRVFRDLLYYCSYQTSYTPRLREPAVRSGLIWQELLRAAAKIEFGFASAVARPLGYYWDNEQTSYVEVHDWIEGRPVCYEADDEIFLNRNRGVGKPARTEMARKKRFMLAMVNLCNQIGAVGLARQYEWYTLVSQANVLSRAKPAGDGLEFTGIDFRPGLAVPFFLPLSPVHLRMALNGIRRGVFVHFDEVDFERLDKFVADNSKAHASLSRLCRQLKQDDQRYRSSSPDLWHAGFQRLSNPEIRGAIAHGLVQDWCKLDGVTSDTALRLQRNPLAFLLFYLLNLIPLVGGFFQRILGSARYRRHLKYLILDRVYFAEVFAASKSCDLLAWLDDARISESRLKTLARSNLFYFLNKVVLSWLPSRLHRLVSDGEVFRRYLFDLVVHPIRLLVKAEYRKVWLTDIIHWQHKRGIVTLSQMDELLEQVAEAHRQGFIRDLGFTIGLEIFSKLVYALLAAYGVSSGDFVPFAITVLGPVPPSGFVRTGYVLFLLIWEFPRMIRQEGNKLFLTRALGLLIAPWRVVGNFFAPFEMFVYCPDLSLLLADYYVSSMVGAIPVLGGRGQLLEYWAFQLVFNVPLSLRKQVLARWSH